MASEFETPRVKSQIYVFEKKNENKRKSRDLVFHCDDDDDEWRVEITERTFAAERRGEGDIRFRARYGWSARRTVDGH